MSEPANGNDGRQRVTIREIADLAGVSIATVSRVVNGRGDVSDETRELVQRVVRERGYSVNRTARGLSAGRTGFVGVTVPKVAPVFFSSILSGAAEASTSRTCASCCARRSTSTSARCRCSSA